ncbi:Uncharacterised protein [Leclercia adecarboxylata]|uniref:Uncharacterized protein n=1 Tax=Leclercia adecarboxylata TaxID=83655 RepID=A0A4U9HPG8_9ENTR|nr:Uncharacterised protein [Leclercia adecarboxylata]
MLPTIKLKVPATNDLVGKFCELTGSNASDMCNFPQM